MAPQAPCHLSPQHPASSSPARLLPLLLFLLFIVSVAISSSAGAVPQGLRKGEAKVNEDNENQYLIDPTLHDPSAHDSEKVELGEQGSFTDGRNDCYAIEFSKNMSTLLSEASHMLGRVKNTRERNWLKVFIRRLTSLADDLLEHPEVRKSGCLRNQKTRGSRDEELRQSLEAKSKNAVFKDHVRAPHKNIPAKSHMTGHVEVENPSLTSSKMLSQNQSALITKAERSNQRDFVTEEMSKIDEGSKLDNNDDLVHQLRIGPPGITDSSSPQQEHPRGVIDVKVWKSPKALHDHTNISSSKRGVTSPRSVTQKGEVLQKLLGEMSSQVQKLKELGGTEKDILNLWNENGLKTPLPVVEVTPSPDVEQDIPDFGYEETGAAAGELQADDNQHDLIVAPSINRIESTKSSIPIVSSSSGLETTDEIYPTPKHALGDQGNDEDDLVRQLQEEKFLSEAAPKSMSSDRHSPEKDSETSTPADGASFKRLDAAPTFG